MSTYEIQGMVCESCVMRITQALHKAGFSDASVTLVPPRVTFASSSIGEEKLQEILLTAGEYTVKKETVREDTAGEHTPASAEPAKSHPATALSSPPQNERLTPLFVILAYILGGVLLRAWIADDYSLTSLMDNFMGGFFIVFSLFKLLNLSGFADAYATYDIIGSRSRAYSLSYPFIELILGVAYLTGVAPILTNAVTLVLMAIGSVGVVQALRSKRKFQCACLGTALKLPMTKVTLVEDLTMGLMALLMLVYHGAV